MIILQQFIWIALWIPVLRFGNFLLLNLHPMDVILERMLIDLKSVETCLCNTYFFKENNFTLECRFHIRIWHLNFPENLRDPFTFISKTCCLTHLGLPNNPIAYFRKTYLKHTLNDLKPHFMISCFDFSIFVKIQHRACNKR